MVSVVYSVRETAIRSNAEKGRAGSLPHPEDTNAHTWQYSVEATSSRMQLSHRQSNSGNSEHPLTQPAYMDSSFVLL